MRCAPPLPRICKFRRRPSTRLIGLLDELERDGLITRRPDPADRRARTVSLTPAGRTRHAAAQADVRAMEDEFLSDLSAADRDRLRRMLTRLATEPPPRRGDSDD